MRIAAFLFSVLLMPVCAAAQNAQTSDSAPDFGDLPIPSWGQAVLDSFSRPLHPVVGGVGSGGGVGFGVGYDSPEDTGWYREAEAMVTVRRYWSVEGEVGRRSSRKRSQIGAFGAVRHMGRLDYFGIGPNTIFEDRSAFRLRETTIGTRGWFRPAPAVRVGGSVAAYLPDLGRGSHPSVPSIEEVFASATIPGFGAEPTFGRYRGFVEFTNQSAVVVDPEDQSPGYRGSYQLALEAVRDHDTGRHNFHRWETEVQQRIPGFKPGQLLTLHGFVAATNSGSDVPFYMLYTLGGSSGLKTFRPDLLGSDRTRATLRGFKNFRFRDRDLVLMQAEYRIPVHRYVHTSVFVDSGQVAPSTSQLFDNLRTTTGFSVSYVRKGRSLGRVDVGFGGGEGVQLFWSFGVFQE
jgi:hypothetical protein